MPYRPRHSVFVVGENMRLKKSVRSKAFLFTIDAILALGLITIVAYSLIALNIQPLYDEKIFALEKLGRDYSNLATDGLTIAPALLDGKTVYTAKPQASNAQVIVRSVLFKYPKLCKCDATNKCITTPIAFDDDCWSSQDLTLFPTDPEYKYKHEAWVVP